MRTSKGSAFGQALSFLLELGPVICGQIYSWDFLPAFDKLATMEELLPPQTLEGAGFERTRVRQFTIFLENRVGRLQGLMRALEKSKGRIVAISIEESADTALVRMICSHPDSS